MTSSIVTHLRSTPTSDLMREAADVIERQQLELSRSAPDLIRIDVCLPNGMPDSEYITHDECRQRLAELGDSHRRWLEVQQLVLTAPKPEQK